MEKLSDRAKQRRLDLGLSQAELAKAVSDLTGKRVSQQSVDQLEKNKVLSPSYLAELAEALKVSVKWLRSGGENPKFDTNAARKSEISDLASMPVWPKDLPVLGAAQGGETGLFVDNGNFFEMVSRPPNLVEVKGAYAVYMVSDSMEPRYHQGDILYVHPHKPARPGASVVVQIGPTESGGEAQYVVKQYVRRAGGKLVLKQLNPPKELSFSLNQVKAVHRIVGTSESE